MRVLLLGAHGFLGSHVGAYLQLAGHQVVSVSRVARKPDDRVHDLFDETRSLLSLLVDIDACIHLACDLVPGSAESAGWPGFSRNVGLSARIADACVEAGVKRLIFASSGGTIYGSDVLQARESMSCAPIGLYGAQKLASESILRARLHERRCRLIILRVANPFGAGQEVKRAHGVIGRIFQSMLNEEAFTVWGDGRQVRDYIHVSDVAAAFGKALAYEGQEDIFNIGSGRGVEMTNLISLCTEVSGKSLDYSCLPKPSYDVNRISLDISKAAMTLGWRPQIGLLDGLANYYHQLAES